MNAKSWIEKLGLVSHPEGGYYKETFRDTKEFNGRSVGTAIFFLLESGDKSRFHRIDSAEVWHFYDGGCLHIVELDEQGRPHVTLLGKEVDKGEVLQYTMLPGRWFGAIPAAGTEYSLVGCTVSPGFIFDTFEEGQRNALLKEFPRAKEWIYRLTDPEALN